MSSVYKEESEENELKDFVYNNVGMVSIQLKLIDTNLNWLFGIAINKLYLMPNF